MDNDIVNSLNSMANLMEMERKHVEAWVKLVRQAAREIEMLRAGGDGEMVGRVAAAILEAGLWKGAWTKANETEMNDARHKARAALAAINGGK